MLFTPKGRGRGLTIKRESTPLATLITGVVPTTTGFNESGVAVSCKYILQQMGQVLITRKNHDMEQVKLNYYYVQ